MVEEVLGFFREFRTTTIHRRVINILLIILLPINVLPIETPTSFFNCARYFKTNMNGRECRMSGDE